MIPEYPNVSDEFLGLVESLNREKGITVNDACPVHDARDGL